MLNEKRINSKIVDIINKNDLDEITQILGQNSAGLKEVKEFSEMCKENKLDFVEFNAALARGLEYYTGIVFEIKVDNGPSVGGGGRYDKLIGNYGGQDTPAVGISYGVSRLFDILKKKGYNYVGIIGEDEKKDGTITIKNLKTGKQEAIKLSAEQVKLFLSD